MDLSRKAKAKTNELKTRRALRNVGRAILTKIIPTEEEKEASRLRKEIASEKRRMQVRACPAPTHACLLRTAPTCARDVSPPPPPPPPSLSTAAAPRYIRAASCDDQCWV